MSLIWLFVYPRLWLSCYASYGATGAHHNGDEVAHHNGDEQRYFKCWLCSILNLFMDIHYMWYLVGLPLFSIWMITSYHEQTLHDFVHLGTWLQHLLKSCERWTCKSLWNYTTRQIEVGYLGPHSWGWKNPKRWVGRVYLAGLISLPLG